MHEYQPGDDVGKLAFWPFDNPASDQGITAAALKTFGRIDHRGSGHTKRFGIWRYCT